MVIESYNVQIIDSVFYIRFFDFNKSSFNHCRNGLIIVFAALAPESATAGIPIPGKTPSPQSTRRLNGVDPSLR